MFQPGNHATIRGPTARAGSNPPCFNGANVQINAATVIPITNGMNALVPLSVDLLYELVNAKITDDNMALLNASTKNACDIVTVGV